MALNRTLKTAKVMDGEHEIATVHGLSFNAIVHLVELNMADAQTLFNQFAGREAESLGEEELIGAGWGMLKTIPVFAAQVISLATDAYDDAPENEDTLSVILDMPLGHQFAVLEKTAQLTFNAGSDPKKLLALALKAAQGGSQSDPQP